MHNPWVVGKNWQTASDSIKSATDHLFVNAHLTVGVNPFSIGLKFGRITTKSRRTRADQDEARAAAKGRG
jgi:hypothetical protein